MQDSIARYFSDIRADTVNENNIDYLNNTESNIKNSYDKPFTKDNLVYNLLK